MRHLYILRGVPGSGKSGVARALADSLDYTTEICSADDFFTDEFGVYTFVPELLAEAHDRCYNRAYDAMAGGCNRVIVDNCNVDPAHFAHYEDAARDFGYRVIHLVVERRHCGRNTHGVSDSQVQDRAERLHQTIRV